ncbi:MAG TPA: alkaline phosphatase family protein, partial [Gemmataceae bacterium]|nr:alkaline phosphatase family protein [Gemmataceae bacterium]
MRAFLVVLVVAALAAVGWWFFTHQRDKDQTGPAEHPKPAAKLVVLVVFDQMRGDYMSRWATHYGPDGFERIKKGGAWYSECHIPYSCTSTGPGHASIATGATPAVHGIVENDWFDRKAGEPVYCAQPMRPYDRVPPLVATGKSTRGSGIGFSPERLLADTVADALKAKGGRVFSLSVKDRTAVMMGGKKPDAAYCFDARDGRFGTGAYYRDTPHAWVEEFNKANLVDTFFEKKWERFKPDIDYTKFAGLDDAPGESAGTNKMGKVFPHPLKGELKEPADRFYAAVEMSPFGNELLFELAKRAIVAEKLGTGTTTDMLCLSFSSNDMIGHAWGPDSHEMMDITLRSDLMI